MSLKNRNFASLRGLALIPTLLVAVLVFAACGGAASPTATATHTPSPTATSQPSPTNTPAATATSVPPTANPTSTPAATDEEYAGTIGVGDGGSLGGILVDENGKTLYIFDKDDEGVSNCSGGCMASWPPALIDGNPGAGSGVTATLGTLARDNGEMQLTINGYPAYYWQGDTVAGQTNGNGIGGNWWVFEPSGDPERPAKVAVADNTDHGQILVDGNGMTLYIFDKDEEDVSNCSGGCLASWPPLLTEYGVVAVGDVSAELGTITRDDGTEQVTVNGYPAYHWQGDTVAGDTNGNGVGNNWWVFESNGDPERPAKVGLYEDPTLGNILVGLNGHTLYIFDNDAVGVSNCTGSCLDNWPPLLTEYDAVALNGVTAELGTITRTDGTEQVTINGYPAYYWAGDTAPGATFGQGVGGKWWVFGADGTPNHG